MSTAHQVDDDWNRPEVRPTLRRGAHMRRKKETRLCAACGKPFHPWSGKRPGRFCSRACTGRHTLARRAPHQMGYVFAVAALLIALALPAAAAAQPTVEPGSLLCASIASTTQQTIDTASPYRGAMRVTSGNDVRLTTERCIANLGPQPTPTKPTLRAPLHCNDAAGDLAYYGIATSLGLTQGVWTWTEEATGDSYVATMECTATGVE